jgi:hypothetical protein
MEQNTALSLQARLIRDLQIKEGQEACFASSTSNDCAKKECCWRHDCFDEALDMQLQQGAS